MIPGPRTSSRSSACKHQCPPHSSSYLTMITPRLHRSQDSSYPDELPPLPVACRRISGAAYCTVKQGVVSATASGSSRAKPKSTTLMSLFFPSPKMSRFCRTQHKIKHSFSASGLDAVHCTVPAVTQSLRGRAHAHHMYITCTSQACHMHVT